MDSIEQALKAAGTLRRRSRKLLLFAAVTTGLINHANGQTFAEWFKQKSTQKKYLLEQIAALQVYRQSALKGYDIARGGLGSIGSAVGKEFQLHDGYYSRLQLVSSAVRNEPQVKEILRRQQDILTQIKAIKHQSGLTTGETTYVQTVCSALLKDCDGQLHDLETVLDDGQAKMSDEERLRQIARLQHNVQDNYRFVTAFGNQLKLYSLHKQQEKMDIETLKSLYGSDH